MRDIYVAIDFRVNGQLKTKYVSLQVSDDEFAGLSRHSTEASYSNDIHPGRNVMDYNLILWLFPQIDERIKPYISAFAGELGLDDIYDMDYFVRLDLPWEEATYSGDRVKDKATLTSVIIPEGVTVIDKGAFRDCKALKSVTLPSSLEVIAGSAFEGCTSLEFLYTNEEWIELDSIGARAFADCTSLPSMYKVTADELGDEAFANCTTLKNLDIMAYIFGKRVFENCTALEHIFLCYQDLDALELSSLNIFKGCRIKNCTLECWDIAYEEVSKHYLFKHFGKIIPQPLNLEPDPVEEVPGHPHSQFPDLIVDEKGTTLLRVLDKPSQTTVVIPSEITAIGEGAFAGCTALKTVMVLSYLQEIGDRAFEGCTSLENIDTNGKHLSLSVIGDSAFAGCVNLPWWYGISVNYIGKKAFSGCTSLKVLEIDAYTIGKWAFQDCTSLEAVRLGYEYRDSLANIKSDLFEGCNLQNCILQCHEKIYKSALKHRILKRFGKIDIIPKDC